MLEIDIQNIRQHNSATEEDRRLMVNSIPEPFIGNPRSARVVFLGLNPGHSDDDEKYHNENSSLRKSIFRNLSHTQMEYPFYPLDPAFKEIGAARWWRPRTRQLKEESGLSERTFAERIMVIEWFPYHSKKFSLPRETYESQKYSFELAKAMLSSRKMIVLLRSRRLWAKVEGKFGNTRNTPMLKNPQCSYISKGNTEGGLFVDIVRELQKQ